jgi:hypothetical protein
MNIWDICSFLLGVIVVIGMAAMAVVLVLVIVLVVIQSVRKHILKR